jgi:hypothetical protein
MLAAQLCVQGDQMGGSVVLCPAAAVRRVGSGKWGGGRLAVGMGGGTGVAQAVAQEAAGWKMCPAASVAPWAGGPDGVAQLPLLGCWKVYGMVLTAVSKPCRSCRRSGV